MKLYSQRDAKWKDHALGWGPHLGTIGMYGCFETTFAAILTATGHDFTPATLDELLTKKKMFLREQSGTFDLLANNTLDRLFPGEYKTSRATGFDAPGIGKAIPSPDTFTVLFISTGRVPTHFVLAWPPDGTRIADPWTGTVVSLAGYGGTAAVKETIFIRHFTPHPRPQPAPPPPPPPLADPLPVPTEPVVDFFSFFTGTASHPLDTFTTEAHAITLAVNWSSENESQAIKVFLGDVVTGKVIFDLPAGVVPKT
jgi:hypothetical protein